MLDIIEIINNYTSIYRLIMINSNYVKTLYKIRLFNFSIKLVFTLSYVHWLTLIMTTTSYKRKAPQQYEGFKAVQPRKRPNINLLDAPSNISDVAALSTKYNDLLEKGAISQETLTANFPGFTENRYQQILASTELYTTSHLPSYDEQKTIAVELDFPKPWDPSTATLIMDVKFTQTDGITAMDAKDIPVNYLPLSWFKMIKVNGSKYYDTNKQC